MSGTLRVYRADVNAYFQVQPSWNGVRLGSGAFTVSLPDSGRNAAIPAHRRREPGGHLSRACLRHFPLKSVVIYDGSAVPTASTTQNVQGFYDAVGGATPGEITTLYAAGGNWNSSSSSVTLASTREPVHRDR